MTSNQLILEERRPGGFADYTFSNNGLPQITISTNTRTISYVALQNSVGYDYLGLRVSEASPLSYTINSTVSWSRQGVLPYSITNLTTAYGQHFYNLRYPYFATAGQAGTPTLGGLRAMVSSMPIIPKPEEYAFVFRLFAMGFVFFYQQQMHKER